MSEVLLAHVLGLVHLLVGEPVDDQLLDEGVELGPGLAADAEDAPVELDHGHHYDGRDHQEGHSDGQEQPATHRPEDQRRQLLEDDRHSYVQVRCDPGVDVLDVALDVQGVTAVRGSQHGLELGLVEVQGHLPYYSVRRETQIQGEDYDFEDVQCKEHEHRYPVAERNNMIELKLFIYVLLLVYWLLGS